MYTPATDPIISTENDEGKKIIFTKAKWEEKNVDHVELLDPKFIARVKKTLEQPLEVWPDYSDYCNGRNDKHCYYSRYSPNSYVKVVIWISSTPYRVVTAYEIDCVKEAKYTGITRLR